MERNKKRKEKKKAFFLHADCRYAGAWGTVHALEGVGQLCKVLLLLWCSSHHPLLIPFRPPKPSASDLVVEIPPAA